MKGIKAGAYIGSNGLFDSATVNAYRASIKGLSATQAEAALSASGLNAAQRQQILTSKESTVANAGQATSFNVLTKAVWANVKAMAKWLVTTPTGWITLAIGATVGLITAYNNVEKKQNELIENARNLQEEYRSFAKDTAGKITSLEGQAEEFNKLAKGVDKYGNNISLASDEYDRYKSIVAEILGYSPELIQGYDAEGNAIADKNGLLERSIELLKEEQRLKLKEMTTDEKTGEAYDAAEAGWQQVQGYEGANTRNEIARWFDDNALRGGVNYEVDIAKVLGIKDEWREEGNNLQNAIINNIDTVVKNIKDKKEELLAISDSDGNAIFSVDEIDNMIDLSNDWQYAYNQWQQDIEDAKHGMDDQFDLYAQRAKSYNDLTDAQKVFVNEYIRATGDITDAEGHLLSEDKILEKAKGYEKFVNEFAELNKLGEGGSVDLTFRPEIDTEELNKKGWEAGEGFATVFSSAISNTDFEDLMPTSTEDTVAINFTPIIVDPNTGEFKGVLSEEELYAYAHDVLAGVREDDLNLQIGAKFEGKNAIDEAVADGERIHYLHEKLFINNDTVDSWEELRKVLVKTGDDAVQAGEKANKMTVSIEDMASAAEGLSKIGTAMKELGEDGRISLDSIAEIKEAVGSSIDNWSEYENILLNAKAGSKELNDALYELTYATLESKFASVGLANATEEQISTSLREAGVTNHVAVAHDALMRSKAEEAATSWLQGNATADNIAKLIDEANMSEADKIAMYDLVAAEIYFNNNTLNVSQKISALQELAIAAGVAESKILSVAEAQAMMATGKTGGYTKAANKALKDAGVSWTIKNHDATYKYGGVEYDKRSDVVAAVAYDQVNKNIDKVSGSSSAYTPTTPIYSSPAKGGGGGGKSAQDDAAKKAEEEEKKRIEAYKESLNVRKDILDRYKAHIDTLDFGLDIFSEDDYEGQFDALSLKLDIATEYGKELKEAFEDAASSMPKTGEEVEALASHLSGLSSDIQSNVKEIREMTVALEKAKIGMIATRSEDYLGEMSKEISALERRMEIAKSDNPDAYEYTEKALDLQMLMPSQASINKKIREKSKEDREIVKMEQETQDKLDEILREQIEKNEKLRDDEKKKLLANMQELRDDTVNKLVEIEGRVGEACVTIETLVDSTNVEFPEPTINFNKATQQFNSFGSVVDRLDTKARNLASSLGLLASTSGIKTPPQMPGKQLATGTPGGNAKAKDLGIAGENYKPEILIDKATGETTLIDKPTLIDITKTDVVGEKATAGLSKFAKGTFKNKEDGFAALMNAKPYDRNLDFVGSWQSGYNESNLPDNSNYQAKYKEYEEKVKQWIEQFDKAGYPFATKHRISSPFGNRIHPITGKLKFHEGVDLDANSGESILSVSAGVVTLAGWNGGYGNCVMIRDAKGALWLYGHMLQQPSVSVGQRVSKGQVIGLVGSTGLSTGPHLHIEIHPGGVKGRGTARNPLQYLEYYAVGTPKGNAKAKDLGVAGENYKPEILVDKKSGEMQYITSPTLIDTTKTDVIGEKETDGIPKFAEGTPTTDKKALAIIKAVCDKYDVPYEIALSVLDQERANLITLEKNEDGDSYSHTSWQLYDGGGVWNLVSESDKKFIEDARKQGENGENFYKAWEIATDYAVKYLRSNYDKHNDWQSALGDYNGSGKNGSYAKSVMGMAKSAPFVNAAKELGKATFGEATKEEEQRNPLIVDLEETIIKSFEEVAGKAHDEFTKSVLNTRWQADQGIIDTFTEQAQFYDAAKIYKDAVVPQAYKAFNDTLYLLNEYMANGGNDPEVIEAYTEAIESQLDTMSNAEKEVEDRRQALIELHDDALSKIDDIIDDHDFYNDWSESDKSKIEYINEKIAADFSMYQKGYLSAKEYDARARALDQERYDAINEEMQKRIDDIEKRATDGETYNKWAEWQYRSDSKLKVIADELKVYTEYFKSGHLSPESFEEYRKELADRAYTEGKSELFSVVDRLISEKETDANEEKEALNLKGSKLDTKKTLMQSHFNIVNSISDERHAIEQDLAESKAMAEYLDKNTRELLFNDDDFDKLSSELDYVQKEVNKLQRSYKKALNTATKETLPTITSQYQMQYETLMKSYEISKADLEIAKKKQKLNNVLNERNVRMFIDGRWQWVANTQDVISAQKELAEAEHGRTKASTSLSQQEDLNAIQTRRDAITEQIAFIDSDLENIRERWTEMQAAIDGEAQDLYQLLNDMVVSGVPELEYIVEHFGGAISNLYTQITGEELKLPIKYSEPEDYMSRILESREVAEVLHYNTLRNAKIRGASPSESGYGETIYSDEEILEIWRKAYPGYPIIENPEPSREVKAPGTLKPPTAIYNFKDGKLLDKFDKLVPITNFDFTETPFFENVNSQPLGSIVGEQVRDFFNDNRVQNNVDQSVDNSVTIHNLTFDGETKTAKDYNSMTRQIVAINT